MEKLLLNCLEVSLGAALVIALMLLFAPLAGKKFSAKWRYWIWLALTLRLLLPFNIHLPSAPIKVQVPEQELSFAHEQPLEDYELPTVPLPVEEEIPLTPWETDENDSPVQLSTGRSISLWTLLAVIWLAGAVGSALWQLLSYRNYQKNTSPWNRPVNDPELLDLYQGLCQEMNIGKLPQLMQNRRLQSPMMIGLLHPAILLPEMDYSEDDYLVILSHELNHYKRHDLWYKLLLIAARCVHWFNPLVYGMLRAADNDLEISCDEAVVKNSSQEVRCQYCEAILRIMCRGKGSYALLSTGFNGGKKVLQRRFAAVLNEKARKGIALGALSLALVLICGTFVACELVGEKQEPQPDEEVLAEENNPLLDVLLSSLNQEKYPDATRYSIQRTKEYLSQLTPEEIGDIFADEAQLNKLLRDSYWDSDRDGRPMMRDLTVWVKAPGDQRSIEKDADKEVFYELCQQVEPSAYSGNPPTGGGYTVSISEGGKETQYHFLGEIETGKILVTVNEDMSCYELNMPESQLHALFAEYLQMEPEKTPEEAVQSQPMIPANQNPTSTVNTAPASNSGKPFKQAFQGLDVHSTEAYQTVSYYTVDEKIIKSILDALDADSMKEAKPKQVLVTYDVKQSGHFIRLVTDNMEQLYLFKDHRQALYRDFAGNSTYYDVDSSTYDKVFTRIKEVQNWKQNPISGDRYSPFHDDYNTLDIYATQSPETMTYTLSIRTFCEMLIDDLDWEQTAQRLVTEDYLSGVDLSDGHYIRISTDTGRMLYIYKDYDQAVYYTGHGFEKYYTVPAGTYERVYKLLNTYRLYQTPGTSATENRFLKEFTEVSVSLHDDGANQEPEVAALDRERSFRMMANIPTGYFVRAEKKENLDLEHGTFVLIENKGGQKLAIYEGKSQVKYYGADGKVAYYELGSDCYDIAAAVAGKLAQETYGRGLWGTALPEDFNAMSIQLSDGAHSVKISDLEEKKAVYTILDSMVKRAKPVNPTALNSTAVSVSVSAQKWNGTFIFDQVNLGQTVVQEGSSQQYLSPVDSYQQLYDIFVSAYNRNERLIHPDKPNILVGNSTPTSAGEPTLSENQMCLRWVLSDGSQEEMYPSASQKNAIKNILSGMKKSDDKFIAESDKIIVYVNENGKTNSYTFWQDGYNRASNRQLVVTDTGTYQVKGNAYAELLSCFDKK